MINIVLSRTKFATLLLVLSSIGTWTSAFGQAPAAQSAQAAQVPEAPKKAHVEGTVVSITGEAIPRAQVRLMPAATLAAITAGPPPNSTATSDDKGKFVFDNVDPGRNYQLRATRPGFNTANYGARSANTTGTSLSLEAGTSLKGLVITMTPQGVISGKITDSNGDPLKSVIVTAMRSGYQRGARTLVTTGTATSNDQGEYRLANLAPGRYYISASGRALLQPQTDQGSGVPGNVTTYYPTALDVAGAAPVNVAPGVEQRGMDVQLRTAKMFAIRGKTVNAATGAPVAGMQVRAMRKGDDGANSLIAQLTQTAGTSKADGSFEIRGLTQGAYTLQNQDTAAILALLTGGPKAADVVKLIGTLDATISDADVSGLVFALGTGATISGKATLEGGDIKTAFPLASGPVDPVQAMLATALAFDGGDDEDLAGFPASISLMPVTGGQIVATSGIKETGAFTLDGIPAGKYTVNVARLPQGYYAKSLTYGGTDVIHAGLDMTSGAGGTMQMVLSNKPASVTGMVANAKGEPQSNVSVTLWTVAPELGSTNGGIRSMLSDQNGSFQFQGLPPGEYRAAAWEDIDTELTQIRDFLGQFAGSDVEKVKLAESGNIALTLKIVSVDKIKAAEGKLP
ncbi:MAG: carboxypeptidase-like regulatory domain-containing protein [Acidobacteriota bacterium]